MIRLVDVHRSFGHEHVLRAFSLDVGAIVDAAVPQQVPGQIREWGKQGCTTFAPNP